MIDLDGARKQLRSLFFILRHSQAIQVQVAQVLAAVGVACIATLLINLHGAVYVVLHAPANRVHETDMIAADGVASIAALLKKLEGVTVILVHSPAVHIHFAQLVAAGRVAVIAGEAVKTNRFREFTGHFNREALFQEIIAGGDPRSRRILRRQTRGIRDVAKGTARHTEEYGGGKAGTCDQFIEKTESHSRMVIQIGSAGPSMLSI